MNFTPSGENFLGFQNFTFQTFSNLHIMEGLWLGSPHFLVVYEIALGHSASLNFVLIFFKRFSHFVKSGGEAFIIGSSQSDMDIPPEERVSVQVYNMRCFADTAASRNWDFPQNEYIPSERTLVGDEVELTQSCYYIKLCLKFK